MGGRRLCGEKDWRNQGKEGQGEGEMAAETCSRARRRGRNCEWMELALSITNQLLFAIRVNQPEGAALRGVTTKESGRGTICGVVVWWYVCGGVWCVALWCVVVV